MPSLYQPRRGGLIEIVSEQAASDVAVDLDKGDGATEDKQLEEKFINNYIQHNVKRIQSASLSLRTASSPASCQGDSNEQQESTRPLSRRASARRLFEINEWDEQQRRLKQKLRPRESNTSSSYNEIKTATKDLLQDYDQLMNKYDFEESRRREFIYRNYCCHVREPFSVAKAKQCERLEKTRTNRNRFNTQQYNKFLEFVNKHKFITRDDYDKHEYDAFARYEDKPDEIQTRFLTDPTLLPYRKWMNERRTLSSLGCRTPAQKNEDPNRIVFDKDFRSHHRATTAPPHFDGHESQNTHTWKLHDQSVIDSPVRRLASAKCYYIVQQSENSINCDPIDPSLSYLRQRSASSSSILPLQNCTPVSS
ncbi:unnamed protein product [Adineta ricciae]|uniref:Uncharacterized protein n=1 Tax=Adineta ricciae TaxID=249248 RepID=A0A814D4B3_ADIRI|nr:unnamed protein product [Adineta ricciae]CAF1254492.1 unnamed protein product [Adineta ricciae]